MQEAAVTEDLAVFAWGVGRKVDTVVRQMWELAHMPAHI